MKKQALFRSVLLLALCAAIVFLCGCRKPQNQIVLEERKIRQMSQLSTIKCKTHAYLEASQDETSWFIKIFNPNQAYHYIAEYDGEFSVGIDFNGLTVNDDTNEVVVTISRPHIIDLNINNETLSDYPVLVFDESRVYLEQRKLPINEYSAMLAEAQKELKEYVEKNRLNYDSAEANAKNLIENYIVQIAKLSKKEYKVRFQYAEEEGK
jgi:hypothetical protein